MTGQWDLSVNNNTKSIQVHAIQIYKQMNEKQSVTITMTPEDAYTYKCTKYTRLRSIGPINLISNNNIVQIKRQQTNSFSFQNPGVQTKQF